MISRSPTDRSKQCANESAKCRDIPSLNWCQSEFALEIEDVGTRQTYEAPKADRVIKAKPVGIWIFKKVPIINQVFALYFARRLFGNDSITNQDKDRREQREPENIFPAIGFRQPWRKKAIQNDTYISSSRKAHDYSLHVRRIPSAGLRQCDCKTCARKPKD